MVQPAQTVRIVQSVPVMAAVLVVHHAQSPRLWDVPPSRSVRSVRSVRGASDHGWFPCFPTFRPKCGVGKSIRNATRDTPLRAAISPVGRLLPKRPQIHQERAHFGGGMAVVLAAGLFDAVP